MTTDTDRERLGKDDYRHSQRDWVKMTTDTNRERLGEDDYRHKQRETG